jgi:hypothetical protein
MTTKSAVNFRTTYVLMGGVALLLGVLAIYVFFFGDKKDDNADGLVFSSLGVKPEHINEINGLEIDKGEEKIVLNKTADGRWRILEPIEARADSDRVHAVISQLLSAKREEKGVDLTPNLKVHGLDPPAVKITLKRSDRVATLALGKITVGGDQAVMYVLAPGDPQKPQAVRKNRLSALFKAKPPDDADAAGAIVGLDDFRTRKLLGEGIDLAGSAARLTGIKLTERLPKGFRIVYLNRNNPDRVWRFEIPPGYGNVELNAPGDKSNPELIHQLPQLLNAALSIEVPEMKDFLTGERDLAALGLDPNSPEVLRVDIERDDAVGNGKETLWISKDEVTKQGDKVYARYEGDSSVVQINAQKPRLLRRFLEDPSTLRERALVKLRPDRVDAIQITTGGKTFELVKGAENRWKVWAGDNAVDANADPISELLQRLSQPNAVRGFPPAEMSDAVLGVDKPVVELKIWEDSIVGAAKGGAKPKLRESPTTRIQFGKKDVGDIVFVRRYLGLSKADVKMPDLLLALAARDRLEYVDIGLKPLDLSKVQKITFPRGSDIYEIERVEQSGLIEWRINSPESKKGKFADPSGLARRLLSYQQLRPEKIVVEKPSADQLASLGLDPKKPRFKLALKLKDEASERVYYFGNVVAKKPSVYTMTSFSDYVFESPKTRIDMFTEEDIVDPVAYRIDSSNVKGMKLKGWSDSSATGMPQVLELERKPGGVWTSKGNLAIDGNKVEEFLNTICKPRAEATIVEKTGPKPEHGLDVNKGALEIEIELIEGKPVTLTLGNVVSKESKLIYATSSQTKGDVFTLKGDKLIPVKEKPAALKKE